MTSRVGIFLIGALGIARTLGAVDDVATNDPLVPKSLVAPFSQAEVQSARQTWAKRLGEKEGFSNRLGMTFTLIPPGEFVMGSPLSEEHRRSHEQQRQVKITQPFYLAVTEVTQEQWRSLMGTSPWSGKRFTRAGPNYAATSTSWNEAVQFCGKLSKAEGRIYRLPTEAEWEYACRAGTTTAYSFGDDQAKMPDYGWIRANAFDVDQTYAHQVGRKKANPFGLFDMHGNNWEWCADWYRESLGESAKHEPLTDPRGAESGVRRVIRGGSWHGSASLCRSASRFFRRPAMQTNDVGFRVVAMPRD